MIFERTLENGLELIVRPTNAPVAAVQVWVDVGSIDEKPQEAGYCHFLEHMLFKGTSRRTTSEIAGTVEGEGGEMNAFTSFEYTVYHITLSNERWALANDILSDMVLGSTFLPKEFNPEKQVILEEIRRGQDSPDRQLYQGAYQMMYGKAGYGRPVIGFPKTVSKCSAAGLKSFWKRWYSPSLMTVVVCGDVDPGAVEKAVQKTWGKVHRKPPRVRRRDADFALRTAGISSAGRLGSHPFPVNSIRWVGALPACSLRDPVLPALDVSGMIIGQGETSRLHRRLFREEQSVSSIGAGVWAPVGNGMYTFDADVPLEKASVFRNQIFEEVERFCDEGPTREELDRAKVAIETERVYGSQSMDGLANRLGFLRTTLGNVRFDLEYIANVRELTPEDVRDAARQFLVKDQMREFALLPKDFESKRLWSGADAVAPSTKTIKKALPEKAPEMRSVKLSNGIQLVLFPRSDIPIVSMQACALGGLRIESHETAGIGNLLSNVWDKGPRDWTAERFSEFLEGRGARIEAFSGRNSIGLSATMLTSHLEDVSPLFVETLLNPALTSDEFRRARNHAIEEIRTLEDDLGRLVGRMFCESIFEGHPYAQPIIGYGDSLSRLSPEMLHRHYKEWIEGAPLVVAVSGKFNPSRVISIFEKLGRSNHETKVPTALPYDGPRAMRVVETKKNREQSHVIIGFKGTRVTDPERYDLRVMMTVLGGQSGRLFTELRDKQGLCYTVAPISFEGIEPGYVGVYMGMDPSKRSQAIEGIQGELAKMVANPISASELKRAKEFILGRHHMDLQINSSVASSSAFSTLYGLGYDEHLKLSQNLKKVTARTVQKLAAKIFDSPSVTALVV
jgi:zinc protease